MVTLDWRVESRAGFSLVELTVENSTAVAQRVRVANRLDGEVWPPRREGVPEAGWDDGGFEGVVASGNRRALGYATPVSPGESSAEPPVELVWSERAGETERDDRDVFSDELTAEVSDEPTPEGVVRALGDPRPPADVVGHPDGDSERPSDDPDRLSSVPDPVESWLSGVEKRARSGGEADQQKLKADQQKLKADQQKLDVDSQKPETDVQKLDPEDRAALRAVAHRIQSLRKHATTDTEGSP